MNIKKSPSLIKHIVFIANVMHDLVRCGQKLSIFIWYFKSLNFIFFIYALNNSVTKYKYILHTKLVLYGDHHIDMIQTIEA